MKRNIFLALFVVACLVIGSAVPGVMDNVVATSKPTLRSSGNSENGPA